MLRLKLIGEYEVHNVNQVIDVQLLCGLKRVRLILTRRRIKSRNVLHDCLLLFIRVELSLFPVLFLLCN